VRLGQLIMNSTPSTYPASDVPASAPAAAAAAASDSVVRRDAANGRPATAMPSSARQTPEETVGRPGVAPPMPAFRCSDAASMPSDAPVDDSMHAAMPVAAISAPVAPSTLRAAAPLPFVNERDADREHAERNREGHQRNALERLHQWRGVKDRADRRQPAEPERDRACQHDGSVGTGIGSLQGPHPSGGRRKSIDC
jgi:hypothetical protein